LLQLGQDYLFSVLPQLLMCTRALSWLPVYATARPLFFFSIFWSGRKNKYPAPIPRMKQNSFSPSTQPDEKGFPWIFFAFPWLGPFSYFCRFSFRPPRKSLGAISIDPLPVFARTTFLLFPYILNPHKGRFNRLLRLFLLVVCSAFFFFLSLCHNKR